MKTNTQSMSATEARSLAKEINRKCSDCFSDAKAVKEWGQWVIKISGGRESCYGRTIIDADDAAEVIRIFGGDVF